MDRIFAQIGEFGYGRIENFGACFVQILNTANFHLNDGKCLRIESQFGEKGQIDDCQCFISLQNVFERL